MTKIFCNTKSDMNHFYMSVGGCQYYLFSQKRKKGVEKYYSNGVDLNRALRHTGKCDRAIHKTMDKLPQYIKYVEQEFGIIILEKTRRKTLQAA